MDYAAESKRMFDQGDYQWAMCLGFHLRQLDSRLTAEWAILCAERLIEIRFPERLPYFRDDLATARQFLISFPQTDDPEKIEREIWDRANRDAPQTAMSKLFTAIREHHQRKNCVIASGAVVCNLVADRWGRAPYGCTSTTRFNMIRQAYFDILSSRPPTA